jgi:UDP-N-acetylglucosamine 2-epimerase (non-hydrolysing)
VKILHVVGARPNFMKAAPVIDALANYPHISQLLVHTGQHYDANMSEIFFKELGLPEPDVNLEVGSGSHAVQTAEIMIHFEPVLLAEKPDWVIVYGDVNSTIATALVAVKHHISVAHVEAGLRSRDRTMPEEINRLLTDQIADLLFTPSADGDENLLQEGIAPEKIHLVGNVMIDTLMRLLPAAKARWPELHARFKLERYALVTLHRPSNVDSADTLAEIMAVLWEISQETPILFPVHPRTRQRIQEINPRLDDSRLQLVDPLGYLDFLALQQQAALVITDSGGIQEEATFLDTPCLTVRENTERPITITLGTNILVGQDLARLQSETKQILAGNRKQGQIPPLWDGNAGQRIAQVIVDTAWGSSL